MSIKFRLMWQELKLNTILKSNSRASSETDTQTDWTWFRRAHDVKTETTPPKPPGSQMW